MMTEPSFRGGFMEAMETLSRMWITTMITVLVNPTHTTGIGLKTRHANREGH
jgi:hypothetical protein